MGLGPGHMQYLFDAGSEALTPDFDCHTGAVSVKVPDSNAAPPFESNTGSRFIAYQSTELRLVECGPPMLCDSSVPDSRIGRRKDVNHVAATLLHGHAGNPNDPVIVKVPVGGVAVVGLLMTLLRMRQR